MPLTGQERHFADQIDGLLERVGKIEQALGGRWKVSDAPSARSTARWPEPAVGIPKPEHDREYAMSFNEMRAEIMKASRTSALVRQCMIRWERDGLSGEELMVLIAYYGLRVLEDEFQRSLDVARKSGVAPPWVAAARDSKP